MKKFILLIAGLLFLSCEKEMVQNPPYEGRDLQLAKGAAEISARGASQISGVGFLADPGECDVASLGAAYAVRMTGDFQGCFYVFIDNFNCSPSGTYRETGREYFDGTYKGASGTFWTTYKFEAKYEGCAENGAALGAEVFGRCQHPIVEGSGTGVFSGVSGRLDMKDDIEAASYPYRGHLRF